MRILPILGAAAFAAALSLASSAQADSLPSCPPGQRMDCHPGNGHHGCGGCVAIEPVEEEPVVEEEPQPEEPQPQEPQSQEPAPAADPSPSEADEERADEEDDATGGGCSIGTTASLGALWVLTPFFVVFARSRIRRRA